MNRRGQVTVEFLIVLIVLMSILVFSIVVFNDRNQGFIYSQETFEAKALAEKLARAINSVYLAGNGAETILVLDKKFDFDVNVSGRFVEVSWKSNFVDAPLLTDDIDFRSASLGKFVNVRNENGTIIVEDADVVETTTTTTLGMGWANPL